MNRLVALLFLVVFTPAAALPPGLAGTWCTRRGWFEPRSATAAPCACCARRAPPAAPTGPSAAPSVDDACCLYYRTAEATTAAPPAPQETVPATLPPPAFRLSLAMNSVAIASRRGPETTTAPRPPPRNAPLLV